MRFKLELTALPGSDIEHAEITFDAPNWDAASQWAAKMLTQIGETGKMNSTITYAKPLDRWALICDGERFTCEARTKTEAMEKANKNFGSRLLRPGHWSSFKGNEASWMAR